MIAWTIKGEAGKTFDATVRSLEAAQIDSAQIDFKSLAEDTFTFSISPQAISSAVVPELKQTITLYRAGVQFFVGHVTNVRNAINSDSQQVQVTVSGPWWWMERIGFTTNLQDGTGATGERLSAVFGSATTGQDLKTSIESVINRCVFLGVPIANVAGGSTVAAMSTFPRITLNQSTCGQVLSELVRLVPDTMVWFDYSGASVKLMVERRGAATTRTFDASVDPIVSLDLNPIIELQVSRVDLPYVTRNSSGLTVFNSQTAGSGSNEKRQVLTISGPELDTFLPNYKYDTTNLTVVDKSSTVMLDLAKASAGVTSMPIFFGPANYNLWDMKPSGSSFANYATKSTYTISGNTLKNSSNVVLGSSWKVLTTPTIPSWLTTPVIDATLNGWLIWLFYRDDGGSTTYSAPQSYYNLTANWQINRLGYLGSSSSPSYFDRAVQLRANPFSMAVKATESTGGAVYAPSDYSFIYPPSGLATFLQAAQSWLPYEGNINLIQEDVGAVRYRGCKINISNSLTEFAAMGALVESETLNISNGSTSINLGCAPRNDYRTIVDKIRKTSQDNIVYV